MSDNNDDPLRETFDTTIGFIEWIAGPFIMAVAGIFVLTTALIFWPVTLGLLIMFAASRA
jgi:hypothetical protein